MYNIKMCLSLVVVVVVGWLVGWLVVDVDGCWMELLQDHVQWWTVILSVWKLKYVINMLLVFMNFFVASKDMKYYLQKQWSVLQLVCYLQHWLFWQGLLFHWILAVNSGSFS